MSKTKIDINNKFYPSTLKQIENPPQTLFVNGEVDLLNTTCLSVVGSRTCTEYGKKWCKIFTEELIKYDLTIVSGMAVGIDSIAHKTALNSNGRTIAVLPCGFDYIYPEENKFLYEMIISNGGCVITEYDSKTQASYKKFVARNRIVSGLSIGTLVVEGAYRSGTSITARFAKEQKRDVFCIPRIFR